jgi:chromatin remodeling complex protein RSC6
MPKKVTSKKSEKAVKAAKKTKSVTKEVAPPAAPQVEASVPQVPALNEQFASLLAQLQALRSQLTTVTTQVRTLSKRADRELKLASKASRKKRKSGNRQPSGFVKPTKISTELAAFLNKPKGTEMARTEVTREINSYIRAHKLQDPKNGRHILADTKLKKLLKLKADDELTYFNLQKFMSPHFAKAVKKVPTTQ